MPYQYQTLAQARTALAARLYNTTQVFWIPAELNLYIQEALRTWNAFTAFWVNEFEFTYNGVTTGTNWLNINTIPASPRVITQRNVDLYTIVLYHLLEPQIAPDGITWQGTPQFALSDLSGALERRQNETILEVGGNIISPTPINLTPGTRYIILPDDFLSVRRVKFVPPRTPTDFGPAQVLWRADIQAFQYFTPFYLQQRQNPVNYAVTDVPPLELEVDFPPQNPGVLDLLVSQAITLAQPPNAQLLGVPDDWSWVLKWGMMMDLLNRQSEAQDQERAEYCKTRYIEGVGLLQTAPWMMAAHTIENVTMDIESTTERDTFDPGWEYNLNARQGVIVAGLDVFAIAPLQGEHPASGIVVSIVQNAPVPVLDADFIQVPRDTLDVILDYAQHLAMFKCGGQEFTDSITLFDNFRKAATLANKRTAALGLYDDVLKSQGRREDLVNVTSE